MATTYILKRETIDTEILSLIKTPLDTPADLPLIIQQELFFYDESRTPKHGDIILFERDGIPSFYDSNENRAVKTNEIFPVGNEYPPNYWGKRATTVYIDKSDFSEIIENYDEDSNTSKFGDIVINFGENELADFKRESKKKKPIKVQIIDDRTVQL